MSTKGQDLCTICGKEAQVIISTMRPYYQDLGYACDNPVCHKKVTYRATKRKNGPLFSIFPVNGRTTCELRQATPEEVEECLKLRAEWNQRRWEA